MPFPAIGVGSVLELGSSKRYVRHGPLWLRVLFSCSPKRTAELQLQLTSAERRLLGTRKQLTQLKLELQLTWSLRGKPVDPLPLSGAT